MTSEPPDIDTRAKEAKTLRSLFDAQPLNQAEFGRRHDIGGQSMVSQYLNGGRPLNLGAAIKFAHGLKVQVADFSPRLAGQAAAAASAGTDSGARAGGSESLAEALAIVAKAIGELSPGQWDMVRARLDKLPGHPEAHEDVAADILPILGRTPSKHARAA